MATSAIDLVQEAMTGLLYDDETLMAQITDVVNDIDDVLYPFVLITHAREKPWHTMGGAESGIGWTIAVTVHIYSEKQTDQEALEILRRIVEILNFSTLSVAGYSSVLCEYTSGRVLVESNKEKLEIRHIPAEFTVRVHQ